MDELDRQIIACLTEHGRMSFAAIGARIGLSAPAVKRRVDRLEADGTIRGYTVLVDEAALGWRTEGFVELYCRGAPLPALRQAAAVHPEVVAAYTVTGDADALLHLRCEDPEHLEQVLERLLETGTVERTRTTLVLTKLTPRS